MITQYSWASVKKQQRKHIEFGIMISLMLAIITFYVVPDFGTNAPVVEEYVAPPIDVVKIPAIIQPPERVRPKTPPVVMPSSEAEEIDIELAWNDIFEGVDNVTLTPPYVPPPEVPIWAVEIEPAPIGGYAAIMRNVIYPEIAIAAGVQGRVVVEALIGIDGLVKEVQVIEGYPRTGLNDAAMEAVWATAFTPAYQRDKPVPVRMNIPIVFRLN